MNVLIQAASTVGALLILGAFYALQRGFWPSNGRAYLWTNLGGALILAVVAIWDRRAGFILLEVAWALVSAAALIRQSRTGSPA